MKKFVAAQKGIETKKQLQRAIDRFVAYYNDVRPHRGVGRRTPRSVFEAREKARADRPDDQDQRSEAAPRQSGLGRLVTLRRRGRLHHIGIGRAYAGWRVAMLIEGLDIEVVGLDGSPLRHLVLDPTKDYQRMP